MYLGVVMLIDHSVIRIWPAGSENGARPHILASHLERRWPAGFNFAIPHSSRGRLASGFCQIAMAGEWFDTNGRLEGFTFTQQPARRSKQMGNATNDGSSIRKEPVGFQFCPAPVLADDAQGTALDTMSSEARESKAIHVEKRVCAPSPVMGRTLAAGRIQFPELQCDSVQNRALQGGTGRLYSGQTQQRNADNIAIT